MWFEILPSFGIVVAAMALPSASAYVINYLVRGLLILKFITKQDVNIRIIGVIWLQVVGNMFRRSLLTEDLRMQYIRNRRLTGDPYVINGLESIPDED